VQGVTTVPTHVEPLADGAAAFRSAGDVGGAAGLVRRVVRDVLGREPRELRFLQTHDGLVAFITLGLDAEPSLADAHAQASDVEARIRAERPDIADVIVHTEP